MAPDELTGAVAAAIALSRDRQTLQIAPDILRKLLRRRIAALWLFAQGFQNNGVQIATEIPLKPFLHGRSCAGNLVQPTVSQVFRDKLALGFCGSWSHTAFKISFWASVSSVYGRRPASNS